MTPTLRWLLASTLLVAAVPVRAVIERNVEKTFTVSGNGTLRVDSSGGGITVSSGPAGTVRVIAHEKIRANSDAAADAALRHLDLRIEQHGNDVTATAKYERSVGWFHFGSPQVQVAFEVVVPAGYASDLHTAGGGVTVGDLAGRVKVRTSGGSIRLGRLGGAVDAHTSGGSIALQAAGGATRLDSSGGSISVGRTAGPAELSTSGGSIRIDTVGPSVRAHTSGGSIRAGIVGPLRGDCSLSTSGGGVRVTVAKNAAFRLDASTWGGGVSAEGLALSHVSERSRNKLVADANGGGPLLELHSSGGSIHVTAR